VGMWLCCSRCVLSKQLVLPWFQLFCFASGHINLQLPGDIWDACRVSDFVFFLVDMMQRPGWAACPLPNSWYAGRWHYRYNQQVLPEIFLILVIRQSRCLCRMQPLLLYDLSLTCTKQSQTMWVIYASIDPSNANDQCGRLTSRLDSSIELHAGSWRCCCSITACRHGGSYKYNVPRIRLTAVGIQNTYQELAAFEVTCCRGTYRVSSWIISLGNSSKFFVEQSEI